MIEIYILILIVLVGFSLLFFRDKNSILVNWLDAKFNDYRNLEKLDSLEFKDQLKGDLNARFERFEDKLDQKLFHIEQKINNKLEENVKSSHQTFEKVLERLTRIDEAQKQMEKLGANVVSLKEILSNKKSRGSLGEVTLYQIVQNVFGEMANLYQTQYKLPNNTLADLVLFLPEPTGTICIDSKFPLENYQKFIDEKNDEMIRQQAEKDFKKDIKKHIDDIAAKYIIEGVTSDQAIMFIPSEAIFAEINANHSDLLEYSYRHKVWFSSPTTLMAMLTTIEIVLKNIERSKYAHIIQQEIKKLSKEFERYTDRWNKLSQHIETVHKDVREIHITTDKITSKFNSIGSVNLDELSE